MGKKLGICTRKDTSNTGANDVVEDGDRNHDG